MDKRTKSLLIGLALGDGHLNPNSGVAIEIEHGEKQKFYLDYKRKLLSDLLHTTEPNVYYNKNKNTFKISKGHRYFRIIRKWLYKDRVKVFTRELLSKLTPEAIALWWMDDGSHSVCRRKGTDKIMSHSFVLYTFTDPESTQNIIDYMYETYDIKFYPINHKLKNGIGQYLKCKTKEGRKLSDLLRPYILPEFQYKILKSGE